MSINQTMKRKIRRVKPLDWGVETYKWHMNHRVTKSGVCLDIEHLGPMEKEGTLMYNVGRCSFLIPWAQIKQWCK